MYNFTKEDEDQVINETDFFSAFETPRETFKNDIPKGDVQVDEDEPEIFETETPKLLTDSEKKDIAGMVVSFFTGTMDGILQAVSGVKEKGRYKPDASSEKELAKLVAFYIPDNFNIPVWMQIIVILTATYTPIIVQVKQDKKENEVKEPETESKKSDEPKNENEPTTRD